VPLRAARRPGGLRGRLNRALVRIHGRVQGVGFRYATLARARSLGLAGWVRNVNDGSVEAVFEGDDERVASMVEWCERGPGGARVDRCDVVFEGPRGERGFGVR
jgi:acylphosphatase